MLPSSFPEACRELSGNDQAAAREPAPRKSTPISPDGSLSRKNAALIAMAILALWLLTRRYGGIFHDATLYTLQAMAILHPELRGDPFFLQSIQSPYSLFNVLYAYAIDTLALMPANFFLTICAGLFWVLALCVFVRRIVETLHSQIAAIVAVLAFSQTYSGDWVFGYGERFLTARLPAEAFIMLGLAAWGAGRHWMGVGAIVLATAFHPLMAPVGFGVLFVQSAYRDRRWLWLPLGVVAVATVLYIMNETRAQALLTTFDPTWEAQVRQRNPCCFMGEWKSDFWVVMAGHLAVLLLALRVASDAERRWILSISLVGVAGPIAAAIGADLLKNVVVTALQPWRSLWLLVLLSNAWLGVVLVRLPAGFISRKILLWCAVGWVAHHFGMEILPIAEITCIAVMISFLEYKNGAIIGKSRLLIETSINLIFIVLFLSLIFTAFLIEHPQGIYKFIIKLISVVVLMGAVLHIMDKGTRAFPVIISLIFIYSLISFYQLNPEKKISTDKAVNNEIFRLIGNNNNVYWPEGSHYMWFNMKRPIYFTCAQGAAALFSKNLADRFFTRMTPLHASGLDHDLKARCLDSKQTELVTSVARDTLESACRSLPDLDAVILTYQVTGVPPSSSWRPPIEEWSKNPKEKVPTYFRYDCSAAVGRSAGT